MDKAQVISNFTVGEVSPNIQGFVDSQEYASALATLENALVMPQGGVSKRTGTYYAATVKDSTKNTRLIPMVFSTGQAFILEFGDTYIRFYTNGGPVLTAPVTQGGIPYEVTTPYSDTEVFSLSVSQLNDVIYLAHANHPPYQLSRITDTLWTFAEMAITDGPYNDVNTTSTTMTASGATGSVTVTASASTFASTDVGRHIRLQNNFNITHVWTAKASASLGDLIVDSNNNVQKCVVAGTTGSSAPTWNTNLDGLTSDGSVTWQLTTANWGWGKITAYTDSTHVTVSVQSDFPTTSATSSWALGAWDGKDGYPALVTFHQERLIFASSPQWPQTIWGSELGRYTSFAPSDLDSTVNSDNAYSFTIASGRQDKIDWIASHKNLVIGTSEAEYMAESSGPTITPMDVNIKLQTTIGGVENVLPIEQDYTIIFPQRSGVYLYKWRFEFQKYGFTGDPINIQADHLFKTGINALSYQRTRQRTLWAVNGDGVLVSATEVGDSWGFSRHPMTNATVKSVAVIPSTTFDQIWLIVERTINGATSQFVEYLESPFDGVLDDAYFVDSGLSYSGTATKTFTGLDHLDGATVVALGDGVVYTGLTVSGGSVTLPVSASTVCIGLAYTMTLETVPIAMPQLEGRLKSGVRAFCRVVNTAGAKIGTDTMDATTLYTGYVRAQLPFGYGKDIQLTATSSDPLPFTMLNALVDYSSGDS